MGIGELARRTGLSASAIRYYEAQRLLPRPERRSGRRVFDESAVAQLVVVQLARDAGFTVAEVRQLVTRFSADRWRPLALRKLAEIRRATERLRAMAAVLERLIACDCFDLEVCGRALRRHPTLLGGTSTRGRRNPSADGASGSSRTRSRPPRNRAEEF
ncbi:MAG: MerR family transcriptional regulator [Syntrophomonadaceae bacterium]